MSGAVPADSVDAAAKALYRIAQPGSYSQLGWGGLIPEWQGIYRTEARAALEASRPFIEAAALRGAADELEYGNPVASWLNDRADAIEDPR